MLDRIGTPKVFQSVRSRMMLVVTLTLVPTLAFILVAAVGDRRRERREIESQTLQLAQSISVEEEQWIEGTRQLLVALGQTPLVRRGEADACGAFLSTLLEQYDNYINFGIIDPTGAVRCSAVPVPAAIDVADRAYFQRAIELGAFAVGESHVSPVTGRPALSFGQPVTNDQGRIQGVLFAALDLRWLNRQDAEKILVQLPQGASLTKIDKNGVVLVHEPEWEAWVGESAAGSPLIRTVLEREQGVLETTGLDGQTGIYAYAPVPSQLHADRIYVIVGIPKGIAFADVRHAFRRNLVGIGLMTAFALTGGWLLSDAFVAGRVRILVDAAKDLGRGDLTTRTELPHDGSELGHLATTFDRMAEALERREVERQQDEERLRQQTERLKVLRALDGANLAAHSLDEIAREALDHVRRFVPCLRATILLFDWETNEMIRLATSGAVSAWLEEGGRIPLDPFVDAEGRLGELMSEGGHRPVQPDRSPADRALFEEGIRAYTVVPLRVNGEPIGALNLGFASGRTLSPHDGQLAREIADALAVPIQNARLLEEVRASREHLRHLSRRLMEAQEAERLHIARELHDQIGQTLTAIKINLQGMERLPHPTSLEAQLTDSIEIIDRALRNVRDLSLDLRPALLDDLGLAAAMESFAERLTERAGIQVHCFVELVETAISPDLEIACFRLFQEALTNAVRHARAENVWVDLREREDELQLTVSDDGIGFDVGSVLRDREHHAHLGLMGMQERVALLGGEIEIDSSPGRGTEIRIRLPLAPESAPDQQKGAR